MKLKHLVIAAALGFLGLSTAVLSQTVTLPQRSVLAQNDLIQIIPNGAPVAGNVYSTVPAITNVTGYYKSGSATADVNGFTYTFTNGITMASFRPASTAAYAYIVLNATPSDGSTNCIFSTATVTAAYICTASTGAGNCTATTINNAITAMVANTRYCYQYSASNSTWDRTQ